jgi:hypothetical protein
MYEAMQQNARSFFTSFTQPTKLGLEQYDAAVNDPISKM